MNIIDNIGIVKSLLHNYPKLRDNDKLLVATIWKSELLQFGSLNAVTAEDFLKLFINNKLTNEQSIRRTRRKLQQEFPDLRGLTWVERHKEQENIIDQLNTEPSFYPGGTP